MARNADRLHAIELRSRGYSYNFISGTLKISKSTLSNWLANIPYTPNEQTIERIGLARAASGAAKSKQRQESLMLARADAVRELGPISQRDLFILGLGLYIGEGSKTAEIIRVVNSSPAVIILMIRWFVESLEIPRQNLRIRLHLYPDCDEEGSLRYWSDVTTIPISQFQKTSFDRRANKKAANSGKLVHGTAHLSVVSRGQKKFGVYLFRKISAWSDLVLRAQGNAGVV